MTTIANQDTHCPVCNEAITIRQIMSTNSFGGKDTDFRSHAMGFDPLHIVISQCKVCGYSDYGGNFDRPHEMSDALKERIRKEIRPLAATDKRTSRIYEAAAQIAEMREAPAEEIANFYLQAAWCCSDEDDILGEIAFRKLAIHHFEAALNTNTVKGSDPIAIIYLIGELYRRIGDDENARNWFNRVIATNDDSQQAAQFRKIAERQRDNPQAKF